MKTMDRIMKTNKYIISLLTALFVLGIGNAWARIYVGKLYSTAGSLPSGWTKDGDYAGGNDDYVKLVASTNYIQTEEFYQNGFTSIIIKARTVGGPSEAQALITVDWVEKGGSTTVLGTITPSRNKFKNDTIKSPASVTGNKAGYIKISCKGAGSSKGSGISEVTINYTHGSWTVAWSVNGEAASGTPSSSAIDYGSVTTLPTTPTSSSNRLEFAGWSATQIDGTTNTRPTDLFIEAATAPIVTSNTTYYAVYGIKGDEFTEYISASYPAAEGEYVLVSNVAAYRYMPNTTSSSANPSLSSGITVSDLGGRLKLTNTITEDMCWDLASTGNSNEFTIRPHGSTTIGLGTTASTGTNLRISGNYKDVGWTLTNSDCNNWIFKSNAATPMYLAAYDDNNWRNYSNSSSNQNGVFYLFKKVESYSYSNYITPSCQKYDITLNGDPAGTLPLGTIESDLDYACEGETVTLIATANDGYEIDSWTITNDDDEDSDITDDVLKDGYKETDAAIEISMPDANITIDASFKAKIYDLYFDKNGGSADGSANATFNSSTITNLSHATTDAEGYVIAGYYTANEGGNKVINADGTFVHGVSPYTDADGKWIYPDDAIFAAQWKTSGTWKTTINATTNGSISVTWNDGEDDQELTSGSQYISASYELTITAIPATNYVINTLTINGVDFTNGDTHTLSEDITIAATFRPAVFANYKFSCASLSAETKLITSGTPVFITSSAEKTVRSQDSILIQGSGLTPSRTLIFPELPSKFKIKSRTNGVLSTEADGSINTVAYIYYTPGEEDTNDGLDELSSIKVAVEGAKPLQIVHEATVKGRHLPANFVIAAKSGGTWYALPANMAVGTPSPVEIVVDNITSPTMVLSADANVFTLHPQTSTILNGGNGQYVKLAMHGQSNAPLKGESGNSTGIGKGANIYVTNDLNADYWWALTQINNSISNARDAKYNFTVANTNVRNLKIWENGGGTGVPKWGLYNTASNMVDEIRLIPYMTEALEATVEGWTDNDMLIAASPSSKSATKVKAEIGENNETVTLADAASDEHVITLNSLDIKEQGGEVIVLKWLDGENEDELKAASFITMPNIIAAGENDDWSDFESAPTLSDIVVISQPMTIGAANAKAQEIVLDQDGNTGKLTINANKGLEVAGKVRVFDGSSFAATTANDLVLESSSAGNATLIFENDGNAATVQLYSKANVASASTWNWQYIGSPYNSVSALSYYGSYLKQWGNDATPGWFNVANGATLDPWVGYSITNNTANETYVTSGTLVQTTSPVELDIPAKPSWILANSWTAPIYIPAMAEGFDENTEQTVYLFNTGYNPSSISGAETGSEEARYAAGTYLSVPVASALEIETPFIAPMQGFVVRNTTDNNKTQDRTAIKLTLDYSTMVRPSSERDVIGGPMHAPKRNKAEEQKPVVLKLLVSGTNYDDCIYLLEREDFTTGFDNGRDGMKLGDVAVAPRMYTKRDDGTKEAVSAVPDLEGRMITFRAGEDSNYTFHFTYDENADALYLLDLNTNSYTRILTGNTYTFSTDDKAEHQRFLLTRYAPTVPTDIENGNDGNMKVVKFIENNHIYVIRQGRVYSIDGCLVK